MQPRGAAEKAKVKPRLGGAEAAKVKSQRVLMLSWEYPPRLVGGMGRHVDELSQALAKTGAWVDVVTAHHPGAPEREEKPDAGGRGGVRVLRAWPSPIHPLDFVCDIHQLGFGLLQRLLAEHVADYDLIHAHDWLVAFPARTLKHGLGLPLVATIHATEAGRMSGIHTPEQHYIHSAEWLLSYEARRVICCSETMAGEVLAGLSTPRDKLRVVPNGVDLERVACREGPEQLKEFRRRWARDDERIIFFVGRLVREKGVEVLIDALPEVIAAHPTAKLVVAGGGWHGHLWERAASKGLGHKVVFAGFVSEEELRRLYAVADVAAFPSLYEPFGIVALEAMAAEVPVVTSDIGGFREVVRHEETGIHTWANNPGSLAWGINRVFSDARLAQRLRTNGRAEVERRYGWEGIAARTREVYAEALSAEQNEAGAPVVPRAGPGVRPRYVAGKEAYRRS